QRKARVIDMEDRHACIGDDRVLARNDGAGATLDGIGGKSRAVRFHALQGCEKKTAFNLAGIRCDAGDLHLAGIAGGQFLEKSDFLQFHGHTKSRFSCARNAAKAVYANQSYSLETIAGGTSC